MIFFFVFQNPNSSVIGTSVAELNQTRRTNWSVSSKKSIREQRLAILLVSIAVTFLIFTLPANIAFMWYEFGSIDTSKSEKLTPFFIITNFFESINYSINFYIYCAVHAEIRSSFIDLCHAVISKITCGKKKFTSNKSLNIVA